MCLVGQNILILWNSKIHYRVGFQVLTAVSMKMAVFWVVAPYSLVQVYQRFRGPFCLHHQGDAPMMEVFTRPRHNDRCDRVVSNLASHSGGPELKSRRAAILINDFRGFYSISPGKCLDSTLN
jgi:hypothetical protein